MAPFSRSSSMTVSDGRLAQVVDVALVGQAQHQDLRSLEGFGAVVERGGGLLNHEVGHGGVDFAGQLDEAGAEVELLGLPGEIEGVDGDAVAAQAGAGIKGLEAEGLGLGRVDDFVDVDVHLHAQLLEFVDQRDVDAAVDVFKQLGHLGRSRAADLDDAAEDGSVERRGKLEQAAGPQPPTTLGMSWRATWFVARVFALGREGDVDAGLVESAGNLQAARVAGFEHGRHDFIRSAGIGGALKDDELVLDECGERWRRRCR